MCLQFSHILSITLFFSHSLPLLLTLKSFACREAGVSVHIFIYVPRKPHGVTVRTMLVTHRQLWRKKDIHWPNCVIVLLFTSSSFEAVACPFSVDNRTIRLPMRSTSLILVILSSFSPAPTWTNRIDYYCSRVCFIIRVSVQKLSRVSFCSPNGLLINWTTISAVWYY